jgi:hypothetical protein
MEDEEMGMVNEMSSSSSSSSSSFSSSDLGASPDFYETLSPEDKETYDLLPNHGGLGRDPDDHGIY